MSEQEAVIEFLSDLADDQIETAKIAIITKSTELITYQSIMLAAESDFIKYNPGNEAFFNVTVANGHAQAQRQLAELMLEKLPTVAASDQAYWQVALERQLAHAVAAERKVEQLMGASNYTSALNKYFTTYGSAATFAAGTTLGIVWQLNIIEKEMNLAIEQGKTPHEVEEIVFEGYTELVATTTGGLFLYIEPAGLLTSSGFLTMVAKSTAASMALSLAFTAGYETGTLMYDTNFFWVQDITRWLIDNSVAFFDNSTLDVYPEGFSNLAILVQAVDPTIDGVVLNQHLMASANSYENFSELKSFVNTIREILTPDLGVVLATTNEDLFNEVVNTMVALHELEIAPEYQIVDVDTLASAALLNNAEGLAYRYALENLNTFAITGSTNLYAQHNQNGELDAENFSQEYLDDRALMLGAILQRNADDNIHPDAINGEAIRFKDVGASEVFAGGNTGGQSGSNTLEADDVTNIVFGTNNDDALISGYAQDDRLYGLGGDDTLIGMGGKDFLQGGAGNDFLYGGDSDGNDDESRDILDGGEGNDSYFVGEGDRILDSDRDVSVIRYRGIEVSGIFTQVTNHFYQNEALGLDLIIIGNDAII
ncbi:hypothetical protein OAP18_02840, partial [Gammaproteobacteria bacterium]|nr:hypothetical protein [Gammaproteobacteria bacterium]